jgi:hypothetical protein
MRRYGMYDATRGLMTALAVAVAGFLLWVATQVGVQTTGRFWAAMGIVAGAGLALTILPVLGSGVHRGLRVRLSPGTFLLGFIPTLIAVGWVLLATQPGNGWNEGRFSSWSSSIGIMGVVHSLGLWHGVLAFGLGAVLGMSLDSVPPLERVDEDVVVDRRMETQPTWRQRPTAPVDADAPVSAEQREAALRSEPPTTTVGPAPVRDRRVDERID